MKVTLNTEQFKEMVSRAIKCSSNNKLIPITSLIAIELKDGKLTLITTDATNYLYVMQDNVVGDDFYAVVDVNVLSKLVSKLTCDSITLEIKDGINALSITGNGSYLIDLPLDENGEAIKYPDPYASITDMQDLGYINRTTIMVILETVKSALAVTLENPCYTGYYVGDKVVATDTYKIANMDVALFAEPKLISSQLMDVLSVMSSEKIKVDSLDNRLIFSTDDCIIVGCVMEGLEDFAIEPITDLVNTEFNHFCSIPKSSLMQTLDRLSIFVGPYDKNEIGLTFTNSGLQISSKADNGIEVIPYVASDNFVEFVCSVDIQMLMQEIKAIQSDVINIYYGNDSGIKFVDGNITIIVAFLEDE